MIMFELYIFLMIFCALIVAAAVAFWAVTNTMKKNNNQGEYVDANQVYMQNFDITLERDFVPDHFRVQDGL